MVYSSLKRFVLLASAILCIATCAADLVLILIFGNQIPGYNQLTQTLSSLGESSSPVACEVTIWSVILGLIFIFFAFGFREVFRMHGKETRRAFWLIILYGLGEGIASGIFRADRINGRLTDIAILHDLLGGIGVAALLVLPYILRKIFTRYSFPLFFRFSMMVWITGIISILLFSLRIRYFENTFPFTYSGLWQRIFLFNYYIYFSVIAFMVIKEINQTHLKSR